MACLSWYASAKLSELIPQQRFIALSGKLEVESFENHVLAPLQEVKNVGRRVPGIVVSSAEIQFAPERAQEEAQAVPQLFARHPRVVHLDGSRLGSNDVVDAAHAGYGHGGVGLWRGHGQRPGRRGYVRGCGGPDGRGEGVVFLVVPDAMVKVFHDLHNTQKLSVADLVVAGGGKVHIDHQTLAGNGMVKGGGMPMRIVRRSTACALVAEDVVDVTHALGLGGSFLDITEDECDGCMEGVRDCCVGSFARGGEQGSLLFGESTSDALVTAWDAGAVSVRYIKDFYVGCIHSGSFLRCHVCQALLLVGSERHGNVGGNAIGRAQVRSLGTIKGRGLVSISFVKGFGGVSDEIA
ncbi:hypothetical protein CGRA01v4_14102 [Colletotrichum graminicola]|nr:hypothetical protein CGRA01v4_14102 [Colletotrichum graminicola]